MKTNRVLFAATISGLLILQGCGGGIGVGTPDDTDANTLAGQNDGARDNEGTSIFDAFRRTDTEAAIQVNRYIWRASLEVLDFLPVQTIDPFTGVIVTGFGTPPGGGRSYRATVLVSDPSLDARSLNVAVQTRGGPVSAATSRAIEDAILNRARQLRIADNRL